MATGCEEPTHWKYRKDGEQEEKGATVNDMVGWYHQLKGLEFQQTLGDSEGQESLVWCSPWGCHT